MSDRSAKGEMRLRRAWQRHAATGGGFVYGNGLNFDLASNSIDLDLASTGGLEFVTAQLAINLDTNPGLALSANGIKAQINGATLTLGSSGLSVTAPEGQFTVTATKTGAYAAAIGELVRCDPSGGTFAVTLPTAVGVSGRQIVVKNVTSSATAITFNTTSAQTIDTAASGATSIAAGFGSRVFMSDGSNWLVIV